MTAATATHLIESNEGGIDLCESQGGAWVTIKRDVDSTTLLRYGFNLDSPAVQAVLAEAASWSGRCLTVSMRNLSAIRN